MLMLRSKRNPKPWLMLLAVVQFCFQNNSYSFPSVDGFFASRLWSEERADLNFQLVILSALTPYLVEKRKLTLKGIIACCGMQDRRIGYCARF